jgi:NADH-quinone oxidoreductase subunit K
MSLSFNHTLIVASLLFLIGLTGVLARRNMIMVLLSIEIMLNAAGLAFIAAGWRWQQPDGQIFFLFILTTAAVEVSLGLALVIRQNHIAQTLDIDAAGTMKG